MYGYILLFKEEPMNTCKILVVDDDKDDIELLSDAFKSNGEGSVHCVHSAKQAFEFLDHIEKEDLPKVIITDIFLPAQNGAQLIHDLKKKEQYKKIPHHSLFYTQSRGGRSTLPRIGCIRLYK